MCGILLTVGAAFRTEFDAALATLKARGPDAREVLAHYPRAALRIISLDIPPHLDIPQEVTVSTAVDWMLAGESQS